MNRKILQVRTLKVVAVENREVAMDPTKRRSAELRWFDGCLLILVVTVALGVLAKVLPRTARPGNNPGLRWAVESIFGKAEVHGSMHLETPFEKIHHWLAPPILREFRAPGQIDRPAPRNNVTGSAD